MKITKTPIQPLEEEKMFGTIFEISAIEEDYLGDPVHLIQPIKRRQSRQWKKDRDVFLLDCMTNNVICDNINKISNDFSYTGVCEIESMNDDLDKERRVQPIEGDTSR